MVEQSPKLEGSCVVVANLMLNTRLRNLSQRCSPEPQPESSGLASTLPAARRSSATLAVARTRLFGLKGLHGKSILGIAAKYRRRKVEAGMACWPVCPQLLSGCVLLVFATTSAGYLD